jgi:hypothetical protein
MVLPQAARVGGFLPALALVVGAAAYLQPAAAEFLRRALQGGE